MIVEFMGWVIKQALEMVDQGIYVDERDIRIEGKGDDY
jgi:hypothetical protein